MREADFNYADFDPSAQTQQDSTLLVKFYTKAVEDQASSCLSAYNLASSTAMAT